MVNIDGFARVITDSKGDIIEVIESHWNDSRIDVGSLEIIDNLGELKTEDAEILLPLIYRHNGSYEDPEESIYVIQEYVLQHGYRQKYYNEIKDFWNSDDECSWRYVDAMIKDYEKLYKEQIDTDSLKSKEEIK
jgi:hypothetical protein